MLVRWAFVSEMIWNAEVLVSYTLASEKQDGADVGCGAGMLCSLKSLRLTIQ